MSAGFSSDIAPSAAPVVVQRPRTPTVMPGARTAAAFSIARNWHSPSYQRFVASPASHSWRVPDTALRSEAHFTNELGNPWDSGHPFGLQHSGGSVRSGCRRFDDPSAGRGQEKGVSNNREGFIHASRERHLSRLHGRLRPGSRPGRADARPHHRRRRAAGSGRAFHRRWRVHQGGGERGTNRRRGAVLIVITHNVQAVRPEGLMKAQP